MSELLQCPFCGSDVESSIAYSASMINCKNENCIMIGCLIDNEPWVDEIEKKWNERASQKELETTKKQLNDWNRLIKRYLEGDLGRDSFFTRAETILAKLSKEGGESEEVCVRCFRARRKREIALQVEHRKLSSVHKSFRYSSHNGGY